jgi:hypothetical protein
MNMISTGAFLPETDASTKQSELVKKLTAAWEKKNSKTARAGGASLMALSLAACGGEDNTPFSAADVSAAETAAAAAATTAALTGADGTVYASVDAAVTSNDADIAAAVDITTDNQAAIDAAVAAVDLTTDNAAATDAAVAADTAFASLADLVAAYDALAAPAGSSYSLTSSADVLSGGAGGDTFTATSSTYGTGDVIIGGGGTDTLNIAATGDIAAATSVTDVENVNVNAAVFATATYNATGVTGATVTFNNTQTGGATSGTLTNVGSNNTIVAGSQMTGTLDVTLTATATGTTIDANSAGTVTVGGVGKEGVTIISDKVGTTASQVAVNIDGEGDATGDVATLKAVGVIDLDINGATDDVDNLTVEGNGGAVTLNFDSADAPESITLEGSQDVTLVGTSAQFTTETITDNTTAGTSTLKITTTSAAAVNAKKAGVDVIEINDAFTAAETYTVADGATVKLTADMFDLNLVVDSTATTETLNLIIDDLGDQTTNGITASDIEALAITTSDTGTAAGDGIATVAGLTTSSTSTVTAAGATKLTFSAAITAASLDASEMTAALTATAAATNKVITGGSAGDTITGYAGAMTIDGGAGTDTVKFGADADISAASVSLSNIEVIQLTGADVDLTTSGSQLTGKTYVIDGDGTNDDDLVVAMDAVSVDLSGLVIDADAVTVTVTNTSVSALAHSITMTNDADTFSSAAGTGAMTVNGMGGNDAITTGTGADVIDGGAGDDTIDTNTGKDTITGGTGNDAYTIAADDSVEASAAYTKIADFGLLAGTYTGAATNDEVAEFQSTNDGGANADILDIEGAIANIIVEADASATASAASTSGVKYAVSNGIVTLSGTNVASIDTLGEWVDEVQAIAATNFETAAFEFSGNTYVFQNTSAGAADTLIELTGLTGVSGVAELANTGAVGDAGYIMIA